MKSFKSLLSEISLPKGEDEQNFKDKHVVQLIKHPVADDDQHTGEVPGVNTRKSKRIAHKRKADYDRGEDKLVYESLDESDSESNNYGITKDILRKVEAKAKETGKIPAVEVMKYIRTKANLTLPRARELHDKIMKESLDESVHPTILKSVHKDFQRYKNLPTSEVLKLHKSMNRVKGEYSSQEVGGKLGMTSDLLRNKHGNKHVDHYFNMSKNDVSKLDESHFDLGDRVKCVDSGMTGKIVKLDKEHGDEDEKYYTVKRDDGKVMKYSPDELKLLKEEVEQLDELSPNKLHAYIKKAAGNLAGNAALAAAQASSSMKKSTPEVKRNIRNRMRGITGASGRLADKANADMYEDELSEISKKTLGSYIKKAGGTSLDSAGSHMATYGKTGDKKYLSKAIKRAKGVEKATDRLTREEADLDEAVEVRHDRYLRSHGKKARDSFGGGGTWAFTHKDRGDVDYNNDKEVYKHSGKFADAKKAAQQWGKKHGHREVYVMESVDYSKEKPNHYIISKRKNDEYGVSQDTGTSYPWDHSVHHGTHKTVAAAKSWAKKHAGKYPHKFTVKEEVELDEQAMTFQNAEKLKSKHLVAMDHHKKNGNSKGYAAHSMVVRKFEDAYDHHGTGVIPSGKIVAASQKAFKDYPHSNMKEEIELEEKLVGRQKELDHNKNGKIDAHDFHLMRKKKKMKEEVELDEVSKDLLGRYASKALRRGDIANRMSKSDSDEMGKIANRRLSGVKRAIDKLATKTGKKSLATSIKKDIDKTKSSGDAYNRGTGSDDQGKSYYRAKQNIGKMREETEIDEALKPTTDMTTWIKDFQKSDAPQFKGKSQEKRRQMAIAAKYGAEREAGIREEAELDEVTRTALKKTVTYVGGDGKSHSRNVPIKRVDRDDYGQDKIRTNESFISETFKAGNIRLNDGSSVSLKAEDASLLNRMFKDLNERNRNTMKSTLMADRNGFNEILSFAREAIK